MYLLFLVDNYRIWKVCAQGDLGWASGIVWDIIQGAQSAWNSSKFRGSSFISKKETSFTQTSQFHIGNNLFAPDLLFCLMDFSQVWYHCKAIFKVNPTPYVTKGRDYSLWKTSAITEIAPPGSSWSYLVYIQSGLILSGHFPLRLGYSPLISHCWKQSLVWISGRNMGSTSSSITRVCTVKSKCVLISSAVGGFCL